MAIGQALAAVGTGNVLKLPQDLALEVALADAMVVGDQDAVAGQDPGVHRSADAVGGRDFPANRAIRSAFPDAAGVVLNGDRQAEHPKDRQSKW